MRPEEEQLFRAANNGDLRVIERLVASNPSMNLDFNVPNGPTPLCSASFYGHLSVVKFLISRSVMVDKPSSDNYSVTPIYAACQQGHLSVVKFLVEAGSDYRKRCWQTSFTPIDVASLMGHASVVDFLAQEIGSDSLNGTRGSGGQSAFVLALAKLHYPIMECLVKKYGVSVDFRLPNGMTPLTFACRKGNHELAAFLLKMGASADMTTKEPTMDRFWSFLNGIRSAITNLFVLSPNAHKYNPGSFKGSGFSPLLEAISNSHLEVVRVLLKHGASPNTQKINGPLNPLVVAVENGSLEITRELLDYGARVGDGEHQENGALFSACRLGNTLIAQLLVERGADFRNKFSVGRSKESKSALELACGHQQHDIINTMIRYSVSSTGQL